MALERLSALPWPNHMVLNSFWNMRQEGEKKIQKRIKTNRWHASVACVDMQM
jgi:hypothetical protein